MENCSHDGKQTKNEKLPVPSTPDSSRYHVYPDWASLQACYGAQVAMLPYLNSATAPSPAAPAYIWAPPQSIITPYGAHYAAFYPHFSHAGVPMVGAAPSVESPVKSSAVSDEGVVKKDKAFDHLAMSIGNTNAHKSEFGNEHRMSDSEATNGSSDVSNGIIPGAGKKRSLQESSNEDPKAQKGGRISASKFQKAKDNLKNVILPDDAPAKKFEDISSGLDTQNVNSSFSSQLPSETRDERELKRERRKQSNRESARRSRLRKQAEAEGLASKVQALSYDNMNLKSEITKLLENSSALKLENAALMARLKDAPLRETEDDGRVKKPVTTVNLLERVNNSSGENQEEEAYESLSPPAKHFQLLDAGPRTDAVAAS